MAAASFPPSFQKRLRTELIDVFWCIIVSHWQGNLHLNMEDLQGTYKYSNDQNEDKDHFLLDSFLNRIQNTPLAEAIQVAKLDHESLTRQIRTFMYENISLLHATDINASDLMLRRSILRIMLKDKIKAFLLPAYEFTNVRPKPSQPAVKNNSENKGKARTTTTTEEKDKSKGSKKEIIKSIQAEVALEDDQKKRFDSDYYADLRNILNISSPPADSLAPTQVNPRQPKHA